MSEVHYSDYLRLDQILNAQFPESDKKGVEAHDEMLFIIIHQAYELWFKQLLYEVDSVHKILSGDSINDNSPELEQVVHRTGRMATILKVLVHQIDILETMTPMDFLDFRNLLRPASGFQSWQFKILEAKLGLKYQHRHGQEYYTSQLRQEQIDMIKSVEGKPSLLELLNRWLERFPVFAKPDFFGKDFGTWPNHPFWKSYRSRYEASLVEGEKGNLKFFDEVFFADKPGEGRQMTPAANRSALFISIYRHYPLLQFPFHFLNNLLEVDEQLSTWRFRHMNMVHRMIGTRVGTGGSSGKEYLKGALEKHYIFKEIAMLNTFLLERRNLPPLDAELEKRLGFSI
jgi:tryptophan 2,3-dioxygenase